MVYLYRQSKKAAEENGEISLWQASNKENILCKNAIESAVADNFDGAVLNKAGAKHVIAEFGYDRTMWVLAASVLSKKDDGRFSHENRVWARSVIPLFISGNDYFPYSSESHPVLLNGFIDQVREMYSRLGLLEKEQCIQSDEPRNYEKKLLILKPEVLNEQYKNPIYQYFYATGGFGCDPEKTGEKVFGQFLADNVKTYFYREDFCGEADSDKLPKWAVKRLSQLELPQMKIRVFQIEHEKDSKNLAYRDYEFVKSKGGVESAVYRQVYGGTVNCECLESVFVLCNSENAPPGYMGESMSVGNVIEICEGKDKGFYFCDSIGFKPIEFDITQTDHEDMMKILIVENDKEPYTAEIRNDIKAMQSVVVGSIEAIYFEPKGDAIVWCNEEFLLNNSEPNRTVGNCLVYGTFYISGNYRNEYGEWDICSLTDEQTEQYSKMFEHPIIAVEQTETEDIEEICEEFEQSEEPGMSLS